MALKSPKFKKPCSHLTKHKRELERIEYTFYRKQFLYYLFIRLSVEKPETKAILVDNVLNIVHQLTLHFTLVVCESCQIKRTASRLTYAEVTALRKRYDLMINNHVTVYGFVRWVLLFFEAKVLSRTDTRWLPQIAFFKRNECTIMHIR